MIKVSKNRFNQMMYAYLIIGLCMVILCLCASVANADYKDTNEHLKKENIVKQETIDKLKKQVEQLQLDMAETKNKLNEMK